MNVHATKPPLTIRLCEPRGFCAGVERAIQIVVLALKKHGAPVYVRHEIVHNRFVVEALRNRGAVFVKELEDIPPEHADRPVVFSAHGVPKSVPADAQARIEPVYETLEGWSDSTFGARSWADLPATAIKYIRRIEELIEAPVALLSTSPERDDTILVKDPFAD